MRPSSTPRPPIVAALALLFACGLANPIARGPGGTPIAARVRTGIAAATFTGDCDDRWNRCSVQLVIGNPGPRLHAARVVAVRVRVGATDLGPLPIETVTQWRGGAYRPWEGSIAPWSSTALGLELGRVRWDRVLAPVAGDRPTIDRDLWVEVDLEIDGEPAVARSVFAVRRSPVAPIMMT